MPVAAERNKERMGGSTLESGGNSKLSERAIRNFWHAYREDMGI